MAKQTDKKAPLSSPLHLFAGAYLLYTAWKLRTAVADRPLFLIAIIVFGIAGAGIIAFAAWGRKDYPEIAAEMRGLCDFSFDSTLELERFLFDEV